MLVGGTFINDVAIILVIYLKGHEIYKIYNNNEYIFFNYFLFLGNGFFRCMEDLEINNRFNLVLSLGKCMLSNFFEA